MKSPALAPQTVNGDFMRSVRRRLVFQQRHAQYSRNCGELTAEDAQQPGTAAVPGLLCTTHLGELHTTAITKIKEMVRKNSRSKGTQELLEVR